MMKTRLIAVALAFVAASSIAQDRPAPHVMLASVDVGKVVGETSPEAKRTKAALARADARCVSPNGLYNQVSVVRNELVAKGVATSNVELLEGLASVLQGANKKVDCAKLLGIYAVNRTSGAPDMSTHSDVVVGLRGLAKSGAFGISVEDPTVRP